MKVETDLKKIKETAETKEEFVFRLIGVVENYGVCPNVFNVYEQLKARLWHVYGSDRQNLPRPQRKEGEGVRRI